MFETSLTTQIVDLQSARGESPQYSVGIEEYIVPGLMQRNEGGIFSADESIGGITSLGDIEATSSLAASPHVEYAISKDLFSRALQSVYGANANTLVLHRLDKDELPPHIIIWWRKTDSPHIPFPSLYQLPFMARTDAYHCITDQVVDALSLLEATDAKGHIGGTWGNANMEDRAVSGLSRGASTNPMGHLHVADYLTPYTNARIARDLPLEDQMNLYRPLDQYLHTLLGPSVSVALNGIARDIVDNIRITTDHVNPSQGEHLFDGHTLSFGEIPLPTAFHLLTEIAGRFDCAYEQLKLVYHNYRQGAIADDYLYAEISAASQGYGFNDEYASAIIAGLFRQLHPTRSQLDSWNADKKTLQRYDDTRAKIERSDRHLRSPITRYIYDMLRLSENVNEVIFTMPEKMSFGYVFEPSAIRLSKRERMVYVNSFRIFPVYATKSTIVERYRGGLIRRAGS